MNIFVLHEDPKEAAKSLCDKHIVKMPLETAQMLCTALQSKGVQDSPYKPAYQKHPCTVWVSQSRANFNWTVEHGLELCAEYTRRYRRRHKCQDVIEWASGYFKRIPELGLTPFAQAMPEVYKNACVVTAYRAYYLGEKASIATWKSPGKTPEWFIGKE
jgi:hypothetical protein